MSISRVFPKLLLTFFLVSLFFAPCNSAAQRTLGVIWEPPVDNEEAMQQLHRFDRLGITVVEIERPLPDRIRNELDSLDFDLYVQAPVRFPVVETFSAPDSSLVATYQHYISEFYGTGIAAFGIFEYGQSNSRSFPDVVSPYINQIKNALNIPLYLKDWDYAPQPVDSLVDFKITRVDVGRNFPGLPDSLFAGVRGFLYRPAPALEYSVAPLKWFLDKTSAFPKAQLFFKSDWLLNFLERHPGIEPILVEYATQSNPLFPLPRETLPRNSRHNGIVLILLLVWGSFVLTYSLVPTYRRSLFRYFFSHKFFVEDVMHRHIRLGLTSLSILIQHALMGGIYLYCLAATWLSPTGNDVIATHLPTLELFGTGYFAYFFMGAFVTLVVELFCVFWLFVINRKIKFPGQVSVLYSWSLHLNILVITILVTLLMAESGSFLLHLLFLLFPAIFIAAFPLTAFNTGQYLRKYKGLFSIATIGIYTLLTSGFLIWVFTDSYLLNIFRLASSIP